MSHGTLHSRPNNFIIWKLLRFAYDLPMIYIVVYTKDFYRHYWCRQISRAPSHYKMTSVLTAVTDVANVKVANTVSSFLPVPRSPIHYGVTSWSPLLMSPKIKNANSLQNDRRSDRRYRCRQFDVAKWVFIAKLMIVINVKIIRKATLKRGTKIFHSDK